MHDLAEACTGLLALERRPHAFSHVTAARLWGMPLPLRDSDLPLHVVALDGRPTMTRRDVIAWARDVPPPVVLRGRLPVLTPAETWVSLATMTPRRGGVVSREWLTAIGDFLVSGERGAWGRTAPLTELDELAAAVDRHGARRGVASLRWALERIRRPVDSPPETFLRLALIGHGLEEPAVQVPVRTVMGVRHADLGYPAAGLLLEYLGDVHRVSKERWRQDLTRVQLFEDAGYRTIMIGADDLRGGARERLLERVARALARRDR